jgi:hypothetical protein
VSAPAKLAAFAAALAVVFAAATLAGATVGPDRDGDSSSEAAQTARKGHDMENQMEGTHTEARGAHGAAADPVRGLAASSDGLTLALDRTAFESRRPAQLNFRVLDSDGSTVRDFDLEHERRMHVIVVRRDGSGFQHVHPELADDGTWSVELTLGEPGVYRVFADFSHDAEAQTLGADLTVDGEADYRPLPPPAPTANTADGYEVRLDQGAPRGGEEAELRFEVTRNGEPVRPQPYLGARGHLVALREGDLAFLHVHPDEDSLAFMATFPSSGRYRLYLQFKHADRVHTAEFTQEVSR